MKIKRYEIQKRRSNTTEWKYHGWRKSESDAFVTMGIESVFFPNSDWRVVKVDQNQPDRNGRQFTISSHK